MLWDGAGGEWKKEGEERVEEEIISLQRYVYPFLTSLNFCFSEWFGSPEGEGGLAFVQVRIGE